MLSEILGANEVASDVFDELSSTKWMNWIVYAIVGQDILTIFDAIIDVIQYNLSSNVIQ